MNQIEILEKLNQFDTEALSEGSDSAFLSVCLCAEDYRVKAKAYLVLERWGDVPTVLALCDNFSQEQRQWQLRLLNIIAVQRLEDAIPFLEKYLFQREYPLLIRGAFVAVVAIGGEKGTELIVKFLKSDFCGYLKDEFLADSLGILMEKDAEAEKIILKDCKEDFAFRHMLDIFKQKGSGNELLTVYPYPDYLSRCAEEAGIMPQEWKRLTYFPRRKKKRSCSQ